RIYRYYGHHHLPGRRLCHTGAEGYRIAEGTGIRCGVCLIFLRLLSITTKIMLQRTIFKITRSHWHQGFLGAGHRASAVFEGIPYTESDPFIVFMDDKLNLPGGSPVGGAHPHAGFETLTLVLQGND